MDEEEINSMILDKESVNNMLYSYMPTEMTLGEFEQVAVTVYLTLENEIKNWARKKGE